MKFQRILDNFYLFWCLELLKISTATKVQVEQNLKLKLVLTELSYHPIKAKALGVMANPEKIDQ